MSNPYKFADLPPINDCPFCWDDRPQLNSNSELRLYWVSCEKCSAEGPTVRLSENEAIKQWNIPTHDIDHMRADCERLRRELDECNGVIR